MANTLTSISIPEFKKIEETESIDIVKNPNTSKLFASCGNGNKFKVEQEIDLAKPVSFLHDTAGAWNEGCFVNTRADNVLATL